MRCQIKQIFSEGELKQWCSSYCMCDLQIGINIAKREENLEKDQPVFL